MNVVIVSFRVYECKLKLDYKKAKKPFLVCGGRHKWFLFLDPFCASLQNKCRLLLICFLDAIN
jgi:hypothetical protein